MVFRRFSKGLRGLIRVDIRTSISVRTTSLEINLGMGYLVVNWET